ncbi:hypothetical protein JaAD80_08170 [Janthinobacterium sp. AD80]|nr:hypothetical protein JaAD80_08170 [Janthinobacterium sp. AD80]
MKQKLSQHGIQLRQRLANLPFSKQPLTPQQGAIRLQFSPRIRYCVQVLGTLCATRLHIQLIPSTCEAIVIGEIHRKSTTCIRGANDLSTQLGRLNDADFRKKCIEDFDRVCRHWIFRQKSSVLLIRFKHRADGSLKCLNVHQKFELQELEQRAHLVCSRPFSALSSQPLLMPRDPDGRKNGDYRSDSLDPGRSIITGPIELHADISNRKAHDSDAAACLPNFHFYPVFYWRNRTTVPIGGGK